MCYSLEVSLAGGIMAYVLGFIILQRKLTIKEKQYVYALLIFSSIQFCDVLLWYSGMNDNKLNYYTTSILIPLILSLQILFNLFIINKFRNPLIIFVAILWILFLFYSFNGYSKPLCSNNFSSPVWANVEINILATFMFAFLIFFPNWKMIIISIIIISLIKLIINGAVGSWWCFISVFISIVYFVTFGKKKYKNIIF